MLNKTGCSGGAAVTLRSVYWRQTGCERLYRAKQHHQRFFYESEDAVAELTNRDVIQGWSSVSPEMVAGFGEEGDVTRRYLLNPAIFAFVGTVAGKRVLDAGCGQGYLARLLANKGAVVTGVEPSDPWYTYAVEREHAEPLGIRYVQADLSTWVTRPHAFDCGDREYGLDGYSRLSPCPAYLHSCPQTQGEFDRLPLAPLF